MENHLRASKLWRPSTNWPWISARLLVNRQRLSTADLSGGTEATSIATCQPWAGWPRIKLHVSSEFTNWMCHMSFNSVWQLLWFTYNPQFWEWICWWLGLQSLWAQRMPRRIAWAWWRYVRVLGHDSLLTCGPMEWDIAWKVISVWPVWVHESCWTLYLAHCNSLPNI